MRRLSGRRAGTPVRDSQWRHASRRAQQIASQDGASAAQATNRKPISPPLKAIIESKSREMLLKYL